jgi:hypothetical protein
MKRFLWLGFVLFFYLICSGCGDTFRPIIIPNPPTFPNPAAAHTVVSINDNAPNAGVTEAVAGSAMVIDVSGDSNVSEANVGLAPVHAVQQTANEVLVVNHSVTGATADSLTKLNFNGTVIGSTTAISLPPNSAPSFVAVAPNDTTAYVTLPNLNAVAVVNTQSNGQQTIQVGSNPVALAVTPDKSKLYVANQGDQTISGFNTLDLSRRVISPANTSSPPIWLLARSDSQRVYVLEQNGTLAWIDTTTSISDTLTETSISVPFATTMIYDGNKNRLYIPGGPQLAIVDVSQSAPQYLAGGPIPTCGQASNCISTAAPSSRAASDPCSLTSAQPLTVTAVAALPDSTRAYVGAYYVDASDNICPQVTVIDAVSYIAGLSVANPGFPDATNPNSLHYVPNCATTRFRFMMVAGGDSTRVYLSSCDGGGVNIIDTSNDTYVENLLAPIGVCSPIQPNVLNPPQNPVFLIAGP